MAPLCPSVPTIIKLLSGHPRRRRQGALSGPLTSSRPWMTLAAGERCVVHAQAIEENTTRVNLRRLIRTAAATVFVVAAVAVGTLTATPAAGASGFTWSIVLAPGNNSLAGVACVTASDCWAVGGAASETAAQHWNGSTWSIIATPDTSSPSNFLRAVTCVGSSDCWAVGVTGTSSSKQALAEDWNGSTWSIVTTPNTSSPSNDLTGVACVTSSNCWAVGVSAAALAAQTLAQHWNGSTWSIVTTPNTSSSSNSLYGVSCVTSSDCWAVGGSSSQTLAEHWNGSAWSIVTTPNTSASDILSGLTCITSSDCWAAGYANTAADGLPATLAEHWNGSAWSIVTTRNPSPSEQNYLTGIACIGASDCWAVGYSVLSNPSPPSIQRTLAEHWNGTAWSIATTPNPPETDSLTGVACISASDCWAVGFIPSKTLIEHGSVGSTTSCGSSQPTVKHVFPIGNPRQDIVRVLITGSCLGGATHVLFGSVPASSFTVTGKNIVASPPQQLAGTADVRVTTPGGTSAINKPDDQYTYYLPRITLVAPNYGPVTGGTTVLIRGSMFSGTPAPTVSFGTGILSSSVVVARDTTIHALVPPHTSGTVDVQVKAFSGPSLATPADHYTYK